MKNFIVYVSGPYSKGDTEANVDRALQVANILIDKGLVPMVPHLTHYWHLRYPHPWKAWIDMDLVMLARCDCMLRLSGESTGADLEEMEAHKASIPVFTNTEDVEAYSKEKQCYEGN